MIVFNASGIHVAPTEMKGTVPLFHHRILNEVTLFGMEIVGKYLSSFMPMEEYCSRDAMLNVAESSFDVAYWNQLENCTSTHKDLVEFIIAPEVHFTKIILTMIYTENTPFKMAVTESLKMYLNSIYGIDSKILMSDEDLSFPEIFDGLSTISGDGIYMADNDLKLYGGGLQ